MLCLIADLKVSISETGGMAPRCQDYLIDGKEADAQIVIDDSLYRYDFWKEKGLGPDIAAYLDSGAWFYTDLLDFDGMMLHASATVIDGEAYLFAGQCGVGKSTHAELLKATYPGALLINDDKPALRKMGDRWMVYGTPWSGKNGININAGYPLKAICLLTLNRDRNDIRTANPLNAATGLVSCSCGRSSKETMRKLAGLINRLMAEIPVFEMDSLADRDAAELAYNTMKKGGKNESQR